MKTIECPPNYRQLYRWLMAMKKSNTAGYNKLIKDGQGEWEKLLAMAKEKGWDKAHG